MIEAISKVLLTFSKWANGLPASCLSLSLLVSLLTKEMAFKDNCDGQCFCWNMISTCWYNCCNCFFVVPTHRAAVKCFQPSILTINQKPILEEPISINLKPYHLGQLFFYLKNDKFWLETPKCWPILTFKIQLTLLLTYKTRNWQ